MMTKENFFKNTKCNWTKVDIENLEKLGSPDFISQSLYWYSEDGVYRLSDHFVYGVKSCDWLLDGDACEFDGMVLAFAKWEDFEEINGKRGWARPKYQKGAVYYDAWNKEYINVNSLS